MPASWYSAIVSYGTLRAAVVARARSARRGIRARARCSNRRSFSGKSPWSARKRETSPAFIARFRRLPRRVGAEAHDQFPKILALQETDESGRRVVDPLDDVFSVSQLAALHQRRRQRAELAIALPMIADDKALDVQPLAHDRHQIGAGARRRVIIFRDHAAHDHAAEIVEAGKDGVLHRAADILEIDIDAVWAGLIERRAEIGIAMVERRVEAKLVLDVAALVGATGDPDHPRTLALGELSGDGADRARGGRHDNGLAFFRLADIGETDIGGHGRHAEDAERGRDRRFGGIELHQAIAGDRAIELPAITAHCVIAFTEAGMVRQ